MFVDKQQKMGKNVENIKFSLGTQLNFMFSTWLPVFVVYPLECLRFLYIFGDPGLTCAIPVIKTGYIKRSQWYAELAILRPFLAIFPQTTLSTFTKARF